MVLHVLIAPAAGTSLSRWLPPPFSCLYSVLPAAVRAPEPWSWTSGWRVEELASGGSALSCHVAMKLLLHVSESCTEFLQFPVCPFSPRHSKSQVWQDGRHPSSSIAHCSWLLLEALKHFVSPNFPLLAKNESPINSTNINPVWDLAGFGGKWEHQCHAATPHL